MLDEIKMKKLLIAQKNEITEFFVYDKLSRMINDTHNKDILERISREELGHYKYWKKYTNRTVKPSKIRIWACVLISRIFGLTFGIKLMEKAEERAQINYTDISDFAPDAKAIVKDEAEHEEQLIGMINEERLRYIGSIVLGLNDALVELTGALAGFTLALQNTRLIVTVGAITGIAASLSMAASEYLSTKAEEDIKSPIKASVYTGIAYIFTVILLIFPYLILKNLYLALGLMMFNAIIVISIFTFYTSIARDASFRRSFFEMALMSLGVASFTFGLGFVVRQFFKVEI